MAVHLALGLVLTVILAVQAGALAAVLRSRRAHAAGRPGRRMDFFWLVIPVAVVVFLAARSWILALGPDAPATATVATVEVPAPARPGSARP